MNQVPAVDDPAADTAAATPAGGQAESSSRWWVTGLWLAHGVVRLWLVVAVTYYAFSKLFLQQMGRLDYAKALYTVGEKSPMGLLWTFMAYSPVVQFLSGLAEATAGVLLLWRRTAWLGGLLGAASMSVVFLLNMTFDVPVKQLSLAMTLGFLLVAAPEAPRLLRFAAGRPTDSSTPPRPVPWPRVHAVTRWLLAPLGLAVVAAVALTTWTTLGHSERAPSALPGIYRVSADPAPPAVQPLPDRRWQQVAFGQWQRREGIAQITVRYTDGELQEGVYRRTGPNTVEVSFYPVLAGDRPLARPVERRVELTWSRAPDGQLRLSGDGRQLLAQPDTEARYLFDRGFSWAPTVPINR